MLRSYRQNAFSVQQLFIPRGVESTSDKLCSAMAKHLHTQSHLEAKREMRIIGPETQLVMSRGGGGGGGGGGGRTSSENHMTFMPLIAFMSHSSALKSAFIASMLIFTCLFFASFHPPTFEFDILCT